MNPLVLHHHLGLGDHIICNGMVRTLYNNGSHYSDIYVFSKEKYSGMIRRMYDNNEHIHVISLPDDPRYEIDCVNKFIMDNHVMNFIRSGFGSSINLIEAGIAKSFDEALYLSAGVPFDKRWSNFSIRRDIAAETFAFKKLNPTNEDYIFVHDDPARGINIVPKNSNNLKIIKNDTSLSVFDMILILNKAKEIHCMESSFRCLIEHIETTSNLFVYTGLRADGHGESPFVTSTSRKPWKIIHSNHT